MLSLKVSVVEPQAEINQGRVILNKNLSSSKRIMAQEINHNKSRSQPNERETYKYSIT